MPVITGPRDTVKLARRLRSEMSLPEVLLWKELRKRPAGFKFRRQHAAGVYILDFYCPSARLAVEVDGWAHDALSVVQRDTVRSAWLRSQGVGTTRIPAKVVLEDVEAVVMRLVQICKDRIRTLPLHHPADGPPPPLGEDSKPSLEMEEGQR